MNINQFIEALEEELEDIPRGILKEDTNYRSVEGFSSMHALIIIAYVDNEFDVLLKGNELKETVTIKDLYNLIQLKIKA